MPRLIEFYVADEKVNYGDLLCPVCKRLYIFICVGMRCTLCEQNSRIICYNMWNVKKSGFDDGKLLAEMRRNAFSFTFGENFKCGELEMTHIVAFK